ncbi:hypothetical protein, partial [Sphingomonas sp. Leaf257]|uniref:hypothetical protein n=1 Tax=Sphingomonas sp. Leaf257 TaxID=1736309 RepID=UPI001F320AC3
PNHLDNSRRHDAAPVSATVPHLWLAHHLVGKAEKTGRLRSSITMPSTACPSAVGLRWLKMASA